MSTKVLGIKVEFLKKSEAVLQIQEWLSKKGKHYITTPNPEMVIDAQSDPIFKAALNNSSLSLADSSRLSWATLIKDTTNPILKFIYLPFFLFPNLIMNKNHYPISAGVDLMEELIKLSEEKAFVTGYLGGSKKVADKLYKCLRQKYPRLKILYCSGNIQVNEKGQSSFDIYNNKMTVSKDIKQQLSNTNSNSAVVLSEVEGSVKDNQGQYDDQETDSSPARNDKMNPHTLNQKIDILFVALGHKKQEKWMSINSPKLNARVMMGVGGAFDYLSGSIPRAPLFMRYLGLEWLFRVIVQPWRIKRFWKLPVFVYKVMTSK